MNNSQLCYVVSGCRLGDRRYGTYRSGGRGPGFFYRTSFPRSDVPRGSAALLKQGMDFHDEADELYALYEAAETPEDADRLYARTNNRDIKSQVSWALAGAFAVSGLRLILRSGTPSSARYGRPHTRTEPATYVGPHVLSGRLGVVLKQSFF